MDDVTAATVLIVRGAGSTGRRLASGLADAGHRPVVMDERTCIHDGVDSVRTTFGEAAAARRAVGEVLRRYGAIDAVVFLPSTVWTLGVSADSAWESHLEQELATVAGVVRTAGSALAARTGVVVQVSEPVRPSDLARPSSLVGAVCGPVIGAFADEFGFRVAPLVTEASGSARGRVVCDRLLAELGAVSDRRAPTAVGSRN